jgi:alkaline phosphatase D
VRAPRYNGVVRFNHGVASGDPGEDRVVIWTRVTPEGAGEVPVRWVVARDRDLKAVVQSGEIVTNAERDFTVKIDVVGLKPGQKFHYGFLVGNVASPVGKTRTLPRGGVDTLKFGIVSCSNHPFGFFNAYEALAKRDDIDVVLHLGDYIYEYGQSGFGGDVGLKLGRIPRPQTEIVTLADYRARHAQYKEEPELQALHAAAVWIVTWDDHEVANDSWNTGAQNHNPEQGEGDWGARKRAALQAYYEWMPVRDPAAGGAFEAINRSFQFGDLATLIMLETRLLARTQPLDYAADMTPATTLWDFSDPAAPKALAPGQTAPGARALPTPFERVGGQLRPILEWSRVRAIDPKKPPANVSFMPDVAAFKRNKIADPARTLLGAPQEEWLKAQVASSRGAGTVWQVLGNQTVMAPVTAPDLSALPASLVAELEKLQPGIGKFLALTKAGVPLSLDTWDGYPAQRARVLDILQRADANPIVVTGDSHAAWANELMGADGATRVAVEFAGTSVTSPGGGNFVSGVDLDAAVTVANRAVKWTDQKNRGFLVLTLKKSEALAEFFTVSTVIAKDYETHLAASFKVKPERGPGVGALEKV